MKLLILNPFNEIKKKGKDLIFKDGVSMHSYGVASELKDKYNITIISPGEEKAFTYNKIKFINIGGEINTSKTLMGNYSYISKAVKHGIKSDYDVIISHLILSPFLSFLRNTTRSRIIGVTHDVYLEKKSIFKYVHESSINQSKKLDHNFSTNDYNKKILIKTYGHDPKKLSVVGNGVNIKEYSYNNKKNNQLVFIGRFVKSKNIKQLINGLKNLLHKEKDLKLVLIGQGILKSKIKEYITDKDLKNKIKILSKLTEKDKIKELQKAKVYVSLSRVEGFGIPLVEAMACGAVPVVSKIKAHEYVMQGRNVGHLVKDEKEMAKKVEELLNNEKQRTKMAREGRRLVEEKWTWKKVAERYDEVISKMNKKRVSTFNKKIEMPLRILFLEITGIIGYLLLIKLRLARWKNAGK